MPFLFSIFNWTIILCDGNMKSTSFCSMQLKRKERKARKPFFFSTKLKFVGMRKVDVQYCIYTSVLSFEFNNILIIQGKLKRIFWNCVPTLKKLLRSHNHSNLLNRYRSIWIIFNVLSLDIFSFSPAMKWKKEEILHKYIYLDGRSYCSNEFE